jgi:hypothetical protein
MAYGSRKGSDTQDFEELPVGVFGVGVNISHG